jgi:hypothetical protein
MVDRDKKRPSSGESGGEEVAREESKKFDQPAEVTLPEERARKFRTVGLSRMRTDWNDPEKITINRVKRLVQTRYEEAFADAELILYGLLNTIREPVTNADGEIVPGPDGLPEWRRNSTGTFVEDWGKLTHREREKYLFQITTGIYLWEQRAADVWGEAMLAKAAWEDAFSIGYEMLEGTKPTIDDRTARGRLESRDEKYFALYLSWFSRKADALVRTMNLLGQRLKDVHTNGG